jgi:hypothetical protein
MSTSTIIFIEELARLVKGIGTALSAWADRLKTELKK